LLRSLLAARLLRPSKWKNLCALRARRIPQIVPNENVKIVFNMIFIGSKINSNFFSNKALMKGETNGFQRGPYVLIGRFLNNATS
jgi:hypothetical protein